MKFFDTDCHWPLVRVTEEWPNWATIGTGVLTAFVFLLGEETKLLGILITLVFLDYLTGVLGAVVRRELSSRQGLLGIARKLGTICALILAHQIDRVLGEGAYIQTATTILLISNEGLSILENLAVLGVPVPGPLREALAVLQRRGNPDADPGRPVALDTPLLADPIHRTPDAG